MFSKKINKLFDLKEVEIKTFENLLDTQLEKLPKKN